MSILRERLRNFETHIRTELASRSYLLEPGTDLLVRIRGFVEYGALVYSEKRILKGVMLEKPDGGLKRIVETCFAQFGLNAEPKPCDILTQEVMGMRVYYEIMEAIP